MTDEVRIAGAAVDGIARHAAEAWPEECCGLLIGDGATIVESMRARNIASDPRRRFLIDPSNHFEAIRLARQAGRAVLGAYHSHPGGEPRPSATDLAEAFDDPGFIHVIAAPGRPQGGDPRPALAAYRFDTGNFVELRLVTVP